MELENLSLNDNINDILIDDCLINIFEYLPNDDKLKIELVCKKWNNLGKLSWSRVKSFEISDWPENSSEFNGIMNVIKRCGPYITKLTTFGYFNEEHELIFQQFVNNCQNIKEFILNSHLVEDLSYYELLFKNNKISSISLYHSVLRKDFLKNLCPDSITKLKLNNSIFQPEKALNNFLSKLKNLKIFEIFYDQESDDNLLALNRGNCVNIEEFSVYSNMEVDTSELSKLLSKQKNLRKLYLEKVDVNKKFLDNLQSVQECPLQELEFVGLDEKNSHCLVNFKNLKVLISKFDSYFLRDEVIENLSKCKNFKKMVINGSKISLTDEGLTENKNEFGNIESLTLINCHNTQVTSIINTVAKFNENLKELIIKSSGEVTDSVIESICLNKNLIVLKLIDFTIKDKIKLIDLINNFLNLKCFHIDFHNLHVLLEFDKVLQEYLDNSGSLPTDIDIIYDEMEKFRF